ncbi:hypothetical protein BM451_02635 [Dickeya dadantii]|nr:hypothetical protein BM451_02635 [Dickeya dadantii]
MDAVSTILTILYVSFDNALQGGTDVRLKRFAIQLRKKSIFEIDFSIILRPHVTTKFFPETLIALAIAIRRGRFAGLDSRVNLNTIYLSVWVFTNV